MKHDNFMFMNAWNDERFHVFMEDDVFQTCLAHAKSWQNWQFKIMAMPRFWWTLRWSCEIPFVICHVGMSLLLTLSMWKIHSLDFMFPCLSACLETCNFATRLIWTCLSFSKSWRMSWIQDPLEFSCKEFWSWHYQLRFDAWHMRSAR